MSRLGAWVGALWEFVVGDDPLSAAGVAVAIGATAAVAALGVPAWWVMPAAVFAVLGLSVRPGR